MSTVKSWITGFAGAGIAFALFSPATTRAQDAADTTDTIEEITIYGTRSALAAGLDKQREADNISNVISADQAGRFPDDSAAEALRRSPGVSFQREERGGEGNFISIRGLDAGLNNVKINGVNSAQSTAGNRRVPFSVIQSDSLSQITVNKTLLPNHDGEGIGGAVELETATPLTRGENFLDVSLEGRSNDFADKTGYRYSVTGARIFGDGRFGILGNVTVRKRYRKTYQVDVLGDWLPTRLPLDANGDPVEDFPDLPEDQAFAESDSFEIEDIRYNIFEDERDNLSATLALEWLVTDSTKLSLAYNSNESEVNNLRNTLTFLQSDDFDNVDTLTGNLIEADGSYHYYGSSPDLRIIAETEDEDLSNDSLSFKGETTLERWSFGYGLGFARAEREIPLSKELNFQIEDLDDIGLVPANVGPTNRSYIDYDLSNRDVPVPLLTDAGYQAAVDATLLRFRDADIDTRMDDDERISAVFDATRFVDSGSLRSIGFGVKYEQTRRSNIDIELWDDDGVGADGTIGGNDDFALSDTNLHNGRIASFSDINNPLPNIPGVLAYDRGAIESFGQTLASGVDFSQIDPSDFEFEEAEEDIAAAYVMGEFGWGDWTLIAGVRAERQSLTVNVAGEVNLDFLDDTRDVGLAGARLIRNSDDTVVLPRFQLNYRPSENTVYRAAAFTAIGRPEFDALGGETSVSFDEEEQELDISQGNANLSPAYSTSFDLGFEHYVGSAGIVGVNLFYKRIENFIFNNEFSDFGRDGSDFDITSIPGLENVDPNNLDISIEIPQNGNTATVKGLELTYVKQFTELPGFWSGFGIYSNVTLQDTEIDVDISPTFARSTPFFNSPEFVGTVALSYEQYGLDATLSYSFQDRQLDTLEFYQIDEWEQPYESLDLSADYRPPFMEEWPGRPKFIFRVADLTDTGSNKPINHETRGRSDRRLDDIEFDGRTIRFGIRASF